jgi:hypothetical protein
MAEEKRYCFDYITETVNGWITEGRKITLQQMFLIPWNVTLPVNGVVACVDQYGEEITNLDDYIRQRREFINVVYDAIKKELQR